MNPQAAPNSEAAEEAESIARFEFGASFSSLNSASSSTSSSTTLPNEGDKLFAAHHQRLDTEGVNQESEFRLHFADESDNAEEDENSEDET